MVQSIFELSAEQLAAVERALLEIMYKQGWIVPSGSDLGASPMFRISIPEYMELIDEQDSDRLCQEMDKWIEELDPLESFILPAGSPAAAHLHHARTVARRAERMVTALAADETVNPQAIAYLNRLSDLLFVLSRACNDDGAADVLWVPGANR